MDKNNLILECKKLIKENPKLKLKKLNKIKDPDKQLYYIKVWIVTENQPLHLLKNSEKRGWRGYHLDHICSISVGYKEKISPEVIGNIRNLRFIPAKENLKKGYKVTQKVLTETKSRNNKIKLRRY